MAEKKDEGLLNPTRGCLARRGQFLVSRLFECQGLFHPVGVRRVDALVPLVAVPLLDPQVLLDRLPVNRNDTRKVEIGMITSWDLSCFACRVRGKRSLSMRVPEVRKNVMLPVRLSHRHR